MKGQYMALALVIALVVMGLSIELLSHSKTNSVQVDRALKVAQEWKATSEKWQGTAGTWETQAKTWRETAENTDRVLAKAMAALDRSVKVGEDLKRQLEEERELTAQLRAEIDNLTPRETPVFPHGRTFGED